jgi:hypothetical protein
VFVTNLRFFRAQFFQLRHYKQEDIDNIIKLLSQGFELLQFHKDLIFLMNCLQRFGLCSNTGLSVLDSYKIELEQQLSFISLADVQQWLNKLERIIGVMPSTYLKYFQRVNESYEV